MQSLLEKSSGPGKADWRRGFQIFHWLDGPQVGLLVSHLIALDTRVAWDPVDKYLSRGLPGEAVTPGGPTRGKVLEFREGLLA